ncbi:MAG: glycosyltransferase family 39 protein [Sporolactobacillus sp.]|nr:glycosyltransferase family 39 protein [Sporolactobacillus sp.]
MSQLKNLLLSLFNVAFALIFLWVLVVAFGATLVYQHQMNLALSVILLLLFAAVVLLFYLAFYRRLARIATRRVRMISRALFVTMLLIEAVLITAFHTIMPPIVDGGHTYTEALYLLKYGHASESIYFQVYPNNIPVTLLRYFLYRIAAGLHMSNYLTIDRLFCAAVLNLGIYLSWKLVRRRSGDRAACFLLLLTLTCFPLFFYIMYFYTDTVTLVFPVLLLTCWLRYKRTDKLRWVTALALTLAAGIQIRPNLILFLPAIAIYMLFVLKWKKAIVNLALIGAAIIAVGFPMQAVEAHYGYVKDPNQSMPALHWIMLGLSKDGGYSIRDYRWSQVQPDQAAKKRADLHRINERIHRLGAPGLLRLWVVKTARTWGTGTHGYNWYMHLSSRPDAAYQYLFGRRIQLMQFIIQVFYIVQLFLLVLSAARYFRTRKADLTTLMQICLFGNFLFYVFLWEAEPRYSLLFMFFMLLGAVDGFQEFVQMMKKAEHRRGIAASGKSRLTLAGSLMVLVSLFGVAAAIPLAEHPYPQRAFLIDQRYAVGPRNIAVDRDHVVGQSFRTGGRFNRIAVGLKGVRGEGLYRMTVTDRRSGRPTGSATFRCSASVPRKQLIIKNGNRPSGRRERQLVIRQISGRRDARLELGAVGRSYEERDTYPDGQMFVNGIPAGKKDLQFSVYQLRHRPYLPQPIFDMLILIPLLMLIFYAFTEYDNIRLVRRNESERPSYRISN